MVDILTSFRHRFFCVARKIFPFEWKERRSSEHLNDLSFPFWSQDLERKVPNWRKVFGIAIREMFTS